jgi:hypothetical protein
MPKYIEWDDLLKIQRGNTQHYPGEAFDAPVRDDWELREDTCGVSHKKAGPKCPHVCWWWFKKNDPVEVCDICPKFNKPG